MRTHLMIAVLRVKTMLPVSNSDRVLKMVVLNISLALPCVYACVCVCVGGWEVKTANKHYCFADQWTSFYVRIHLPKAFSLSSNPALRADGRNRRREGPRRGPAGRLTLVNLTSANMTPAPRPRRCGEGGRSAGERWRMRRNMEEERKHWRRPESGIC